MENCIKYFSMNINMLQITTSNNYKFSNCNYIALHGLRKDDNSK